MEGKRENIVLITSMWEGETGRHNIYRGYIGSIYLNTSCKGSFPASSI